MNDKEKIEKLLGSLTKVQASELSELLLSQTNITELVEEETKAKLESAESSLILSEEKEPKEEEDDKEEDLELSEDDKKEKKDDDDDSLVLSAKIDKLKAELETTQLQLSKTKELLKTYLI